MKARDTKSGFRVTNLVRQLSPTLEQPSATGRRCISHGHELMPSGRFRTLGRKSVWSGGRRCVNDLMLLARPCISLYLCILTASNGRPRLNSKLWDVHRHPTSHVITLAKTSIVHTRSEFDLSQKPYTSPRRKRGLSSPARLVVIPAGSARASPHSKSFLFPERCDLK